MNARIARTIAATAVAAAVLGAGPLAAQAPAYPSQRILLIVGFPPGGPADLATRALADGLAPRLGKPVVVENRPGGGGSAAAAAVARAEPDGHTLMVAGEGPISVVPALATPPYDALAGLTSVGVFAAGGCTVVAVNPAFPANDLKSLVAHAKAASDPITYASSGLGTPSDTVAAEFAQTAGIKLKRVIYRGAGPALTDLLAGHVPLMFPTAGQAAEAIKAGKLRGLAVSTAVRCKILPDVPTMREQGVALEAGRIWFGLFAPSAVPVAVADRLFAETRAVAATPDLAKRIDTLLLSPVLHANRAESHAYALKDAAEWQQKVKTVPGLR
jgi:tripartite-type tricarboxylate transporter receptor subunit TctC